MTTHFYRSSEPEGEFKKTVDENKVGILLCTQETPQEHEKFFLLTEFWQAKCNMSFRIRFRHTPRCALSVGGRVREAADIMIDSSFYIVTRGVMNDLAPW